MVGRDRNMEQNMDAGWELHPIGGDTGQAYMAVRAQERVFLKRNSSPFLAALSGEGIAPKLMWTKRSGNGDILTAQEWLNGRSFNNWRNEFNGSDWFIKRNPSVS